MLLQFSSLLDIKRLCLGHTFKVFHNHALYLIKNIMLRPYIFICIFRVFHNHYNSDNYYTPILKDVHVKEHVSFVRQFLQSKFMPTYFILRLSQFYIY